MPTTRMHFFHGVQFSQPDNLEQISSILFAERCFRLCSTHTACWLHLLQQAIEASGNGTRNLLQRRLRNQKGLTIWSWGSRSWQHTRAMSCHRTLRSTRGGVSTNWLPQQSLGNVHHSQGSA